MTHLFGLDIRTAWAVFDATFLNQANWFISPPVLLLIGVTDRSGASRFVDTLGSIKPG